MTEILSESIALPDWAEGTVNLASPRLGTEAFRCSDESFAPVARMLADAPPVFKPGVFDGYGKWMDGWESRRRRDGGHDWCMIRLGARSAIKGFDIDTTFFTGNFPPAVSIWAADTNGEPVDADWVEIVPSANLGPSAHHFVQTAKPGPWRWLKVNMYPDGGIARLRAYGDTVPAWNGDEVAELSALKNGGRVLAYNDAHYGDIWSVLSEGRGVNMGDGWETRRRREPGNDWLIVKLGAPGIIERIEVDTAHFKGNYPDTCSLQAAFVDWGTDRSATVQSMFWPHLMHEKKLQPDHLHSFAAPDITAIGPVSHVRLNIHPDGGISRLRIWGQRR